jgi:hypothetical protein
MSGDDERQFIDVALASHVACLIPDRMYAGPRHDCIRTSVEFLGYPGFEPAGVRASWLMLGREFSSARLPMEEIRPRFMRVLPERSRDIRHVVSRSASPVVVFERCRLGDQGRRQGSGACSRP